MRRKIHNKKLSLNFALLLSSIALAITLPGCNSGRKMPTIKPNYLLTGDFVETDGAFDYYDIGDNELAISLNEASKKTYTGNSNIIQIPLVHDGKNVTGIWHNAFHCNPATTVRLTNNIRTIDFEAFLYSGITSFVVPYTVSAIGDAAFYSCADLETVSFVNSNQESSGSATDCYCDADGVPYGTDETSTTVINSTLKKIPSFCFFKCESLTTVSLPASIEEICEEAFNGCYALDCPFYFQKIKKIRSRAFQGCAELRTVYISGSLFTDEVGIEPHAFNFCSTQAAPNNLEIVFCGDSATVSSWVGNHPNWGWYNDVGNPADNSYSYRLETGSTYFSADWDYTCDENGDVTITKYNGKVPDSTSGYFISVPDHMPSPANNKVIRIARSTFDETTRLALRRLYLPKTLVAIENNMFNIWQASGNDVTSPAQQNNSYFNYNNSHGYKNLAVLADNTQCAVDKQLYDNGQEANIEKRIDLSGLTELEFIGFRAISGIGGKDASKTIKTLRLPANIRAIGDEAFGIFNSRVLPEITEFTWDFDESTSRLEVIGTDAFYGLGSSRSDSNYGYGEIKGNVAWKAHTASTIIFPKTFKYFANTSTDKNRYKTQAVHPFDFSNWTGSKSARPAHAFLGCSLLGKVIFKGGSQAETTDLIIPLQTFVYTESLRTIVFEERENHYITFHCQQDSGGTNNYGQESIGGNAGRGSNDYRGEPFLQTIVLPNKTTKLRFQNFSFHGNSRATMYLSGSFGTNMYHDNKNSTWTNMQFEEKSLSNAKQWKTIGDEKFFDSKGDVKIAGYNFSPDQNNHDTDETLLTYILDQQIPVYQNVHYKEVLDIKNTPSDATDDVTVEVGSGNSFEFYEDTTNYCYFVCGEVGGINVATMTNYMFNMHDGRDNTQKTTATVPGTVTINVGGTNKTYTVNKIGDSAFSACHHEGNDGGNYTLGTIKLPNSIVSIGDYAFIRTHGLTSILSYASDPSTATEGMPSSLAYIGRSAFLFSGIKQILKIPNACRFYENYVITPTGVIDDAENPTSAPDVKISSTFSNAVDLRKITFLKNGSEVASSDYYETTQYTSAASGNPTRTCAIYSKDSSGLDYNKNRLLLVLNRDNGDKAKPSAANTDADAVTSGVRFNGLYKTNPYMFGAFRMGYWIKELRCGNPTLASNGTDVLAQPLFSAYGTRSNNNSTLSKKLLYLGVIWSGYDGLGCYVDTIAGNVLNLPEYAMNGCEVLQNVEFPVQAGAKIPDGVFANVTNANTQYYVEGDTPVAHTLDLTNSQYAEIGNQTFMSNPSIQNFIAPDVNSFTVGSEAFATCTNLQTVDFSEVNTSLRVKSNAFYNCDNLTSVDFGDVSGSVIINSGAFNDCAKLSTINFGNVTGSVTIDAEAFKGCGNSNITLNFASVTGSLTVNGNAFNGSKVSSITWPSSSSCQITLGCADPNKDDGGAFQNCDSLTSVTLPANLTACGDAAFKDCDNLQTVIVSSQYALENIETSAFESCDKLKTVTTDGSDNAIVKRIGAKAFKDCPLLDAFDFDKFTNIQSIYNSAFENSGPIMPNGNVILPTKLAYVYSNAFKNSGIVTLTIRSSSLNVDPGCFSSCSSLTAVRFTNHGCSWPDTTSTDIFSDCPNLVELQLPTGFDIANSGYNGTSTFFIKNDEHVNLYTYTKYTPSTVATAGWRTWSVGLELPLHYFVEDIDDLLDGGVITNSPSVADGTVLFWTTDANGHAINLGTVSSYDGTTVTFSSGYTLDSSGFHAGA